MMTVVTINARVNTIVAWDANLHPQLPVMSASFKMTTTFSWPEP